MENEGKYMVNKNKLYSIALVSTAIILGSPIRSNVQN